MIDEINLASYSQVQAYDAWEPEGWGSQGEVGRIAALLSQKIIKKIEPALLGNAEQKCEVLDASYS